MDTKKWVVVEFLDKYEVAWCYEDVVACLDVGGVKCLDKNNRDSFDVDFLLTHPVE